jgi:hypothetical protein
MAVASELGDSSCRRFYCKGTATWHDERSESGYCSACVSAKRELGWFFRLQPFLRVLSLPFLFLGGVGIVVQVASWSEDAYVRLGKWLAVFVLAVAIFGFGFSLRWIATIRSFHPAKADPAGAGASTSGEAAGQATETSELVAARVTDAKAKSSWIAAGGRGDLPEVTSARLAPVELGAQLKEGRRLSSQVLENVASNPARATNLYRALLVVEAPHVVRVCRDMADRNPAAARAILALARRSQEHGNPVLRWAFGAPFMVVGLVPFFSIVGHNVGGAVGALIGFEGLGAVFWWMGTITPPRAKTIIETLS